MRSCPGCGELMEDLGYADTSENERRVELVRTFRCRPCGEEYVVDEAPPEGWRQDIRAAVRAHRRAS